MQGLQVFEPGQQKAGPNTGHKSNQTIADGIRLNLPPQVPVTETPLQFSLMPVGWESPCFVKS